jgi:cysteine desulfurase / selenocysteine lyase
MSARALDGLAAVPGITIYGPRDAARRTSLVAFNLAGRDPVGVAEALNRAGVESRARAATAPRSPTTRSG